MGLVIARVAIVYRVVIATAVVLNVMFVIRRTGGYQRMTVSLRQRQHPHPHPHPHLAVVGRQHPHPHQVVVAHPHPRPHQVAAV